MIYENIIYLIFKQFKNLVKLFKKIKFIYNWKNIILINNFYKIFYLIFLKIYFF